MADYKVPDQYSSSSYTAMQSPSSSTGAPNKRPILPSPTVAFPNYWEKPATATVFDFAQRLKKGPLKDEVQYKISVDGLTIFIGFGRHGFLGVSTFGLRGLEWATRYSPPPPPSMWSPQATHRLFKDFHGRQILNSPTPPRQTKKLCFVWLKGWQAQKPEEAV